MFELNEQRDDEHIGSKLEGKCQDGEMKAKEEELRGNKQKALDKIECGRRERNDPDENESTEQ